MWLHLVLAAEAARVAKLFKISLVVAFAVSRESSVPPHFRSAALLVSGRQSGVLCTDYTEKRET